MSATASIQKGRGAPLRHVEKLRALWRAQARRREARLLRARLRRLAPRLVRDIGLAAWAEAPAGGWDELRPSAALAAAFGR